MKFSCFPVFIVLLVSTSAQDKLPSVTPPQFTNPPRVGHHEHQDRLPRPPHPPKTPTPTMTPTAPAPIAPSVAPIKPNNPPRGPHAPREHRGSTLGPVGSAACSALATRLALLIGNSLPGCPNAALKTCLGADVYQGQAVAYIQSLIDAGRTFTDLKLVQYYALACIYYATGGSGWTKTWVSPTTDPCDQPWTGVTCVNELVTGLDFHNLKLVGDFPCEVVLFSADNAIGAGSLTSLSLRSTSVTNTNDPDLKWIGGLGSGMHVLSLGETPLHTTDGVLDSVASLSNLQSFDCSYSAFSGPIRSTPFASLSKLTTLYLSGITFSSSIPAGIAALTQLQELDVYQAGITGDLSFLSSMTSLTGLGVSYNNIGGTLPTILGKLLKLKYLYADDNNIGGKLPTELGLLSNSLKEVFLFQNQLTGMIPAEYTSLHLNFFRVENNNLAGTIFSSGLCSSLGSIAWDCNLYVGCQACCGGASKCEFF